MKKGAADTFFSSNNYSKNDNMYYCLDVVIKMASLCWALPQGFCYNITFSSRELYEVPDNLVLPKSDRSGDQSQE